MIKEEQIVSKREGEGICRFEGQGRALREVHRSF